MSLNQLIYRKQKAAFAKRIIEKKFLMSLLFVLAIVTIVSIAMNPTEENMQNIGGSYVIFAISMAAIGNIESLSGKNRQGKQIKSKLYILHYDQFDETSGFPSPNTQREIGNIPLMAGELWHYAESVEDTPVNSSTGELGDIAATITNEFTFTVGGISPELETLLEDGIGERFFVVMEICATGQKKLFGTACKPVKLSKFEGGFGTDYTGYTITFNNTGGSLPFTYNGTTQIASATSIVADATTHAFSAASNVYQFSANTVATQFDAFSGIGDADVGKKITLLGATANTNASTIESTSSGFILASGAIWTANPGSEITFEIFKNGSSSYTLIEVNRVQTA